MAEVKQETPLSREDLEKRIDLLEKKLDQHAWLALMMFGGTWIIGIVSESKPDLVHGITWLGLVGLVLGASLMIIGFLKSRIPKKS
jgi:hypothetical protein